MGNKPITCYWCNKPITERENLRTANIKMLVRPFHEDCFQKRVEKKKESASMFFDATPFNGRYANIMTAIFLVLYVLFIFIIEVPTIAYVLVLLYPLYRLYSWLRFERRL
ncbi:hypothetical protein [Alkalibacillus almallahensis]|uniref:hypothetical protein n=1 Tax=Alkalibacillus almallahensis TaxID=1379154 RepID=UPI001421D770|nr:hypothetical protein [Alkalibacillus almallahensis]NIK11957.1 hypothetical protein [Alkalibacillus almallahensis]